MLQPFFFFSFAPLPCGLEIETQPLHFFPSLTKWKYRLPPILTSAATRTLRIFLASGHLGSALSDVLPLDAFGVGLRGGYFICLALGSEVWSLHVFGWVRYLIWRLFTGCPA